MRFRAFWIVLDCRAAVGNGLSSLEDIIEPRLRLGILGTDPERCPELGDRFVELIQKVVTLGELIVGVFIL